MKPFGSGSSTLVRPCSGPGPRREQVGSRTGTAVAFVYRVMAVKPYTRTLGPLPFARFAVYVVASVVKGPLGRSSGVVAVEQPHAPAARSITPSALRFIGDQSEV